VPVSSASPFDDDPMAALATLIATQTGTYNGGDEDEEEDERYAAIPERKEVTGGFELPPDDDDEDDDLAGFDIDEVLAKAIDMGASDVHLNADDQVSYSVLGDIIRVSDYGMVTPTITQRLQLSIISHVLEDAFAVALELDTSYVLRTGRHRGRRTRLNVGKSFGSITLVFRIVSDNIPTPDELGVSGELLEWASLPSGLVLVCGPTGTGKSTTFASIVQKIQHERPVKIITIEKPIEYVYGKKGKALVVQREVGLDTRSYSGALDSAMRAAPDVIMVGEVRNQEEIEALMRASESGHLALSTMHSSSPSINRISSMFTGEDRIRVLGSLEDNLRGLVNQVLVKSPDGRSRKAVREVLGVNDEVARLVGTGDGRGIRAYQMEHGITMDHELVKAVQKGWCTVAEARTKSAYPRVFDGLVKAQGLAK
jgi:twitching motility protein PilT